MKRTVLEVGLAAVAGWCALVLPVILDPNRQRHRAAFLPFMRDAVEGIQVYSLGRLFGVGLLLGLIGRAPILMLGLASIATFPLWSAIDLVMRSDAHNLLPIEWFFYLVYGFIATAGVSVGRVALKYWHGLGNAKPEKP